MHFSQLFVVLKPFQKCIVPGIAFTGVNKMIHEIKTYFPGNLHLLTTCPRGSHHQLKREIPFWKITGWRLTVLACSYGTVISVFSGIFRWRKINDASCYVDQFPFYLEIFIQASSFLFFFYSSARSLLKLVWCLFAMFWKMFDAGFLSFKSF